MESSIVGTKYGWLRGISVATDVWGFLGIPYAAPPVGPLRWRPPANPSAWSGVREAATFGPDPMQGPGNGKRVSRASSMSEDCLYLNIWVPKQHRAGGWPVFVWSGGGAFTTGGGAFVEEDPSRLAAKGAVVVSFNCRLNIFGFFAHAGLSAESPHGSSGNYGLLDHAAVFKWVRENIGGFNGNSNRITFLAESAGATAGLLLLTSPLEQNLFDRAILLSPGAFSSLLPLEGAECHGAVLGDTVEEMRNIPAVELLERAKRLPASGSSLWAARPMRPIVDGWLLVRSNAFDTAKFKSLPAIIGNNEAEGRFFMRRMSIETTEDYVRFIHDSFGNRADEALARYPVTSDADVATMFSAAYGDRAFTYPIDRLIRAFARREHKIYRYVYTYRYGNTTKPATHSEEVGIMMNTQPHVRPEDGEMADIMARYWIAFAETGNPNTPGLPEWPEYAEANNQYLNLDVPLSVGSNWRSAQIGFIARMMESVNEGS
jgi:para-nitrobenzyl esterase